MKVQPLFLQIVDHYYNAYKRVVSNKDRSTNHPGHLFFTAGFVVIEWKNNKAFFKDILNRGERCCFDSTDTVRLVGLNAFLIKKDGPKRRMSNTALRNEEVKHLLCECESLNWKELVAGQKDDWFVEN